MKERKSAGRDYIMLVCGRVCMFHFFFYQVHSSAELQFYFPSWWKFFSSTSTLRFCRVSTVSAGTEIVFSVVCCLSGMCCACVSIKQ